MGEKELELFYIIALAHNAKVKVLYDKIISEHSDQLDDYIHALAYAYITTKSGKIEEIKDGRYTSIPKLDAKISEILASFGKEFKLDLNAESKKSNLSWLLKYALDFPNGFFDADIKDVILMDILTEYRNLTKDNLTDICDEPKPMSDEESSSLINTVIKLSISSIHKFSKGNSIINLHPIDLANILANFINHLLENNGYYRRFSAFELLELVKEYEHEMEREKLSRFLSSVSKYSSLLDSGKSVDDIYGTEIKKIVSASLFLDLGEDLVLNEELNLAYAYAKLHPGEKIKENSPVMRKMYFQINGMK